MIYLNPAVRRVAVAWLMESSRPRGFPLDVLQGTKPDTDLHIL